MAPAVTAKVIVLQSHPVWVAAQKGQRERREAMSRHPSSHVRRGMVRNVVGQLASRLTYEWGVEDNSRRPTLRVLS
ncbi:MAG: hypothetical protein EPN51_14535 [Mycobacterium sp.]|nr:MAG: hypothetical protein EPN51_14535 [Mycobacterium sp.]